jgi:hypothetical protein
MLRFSSHSWTPDLIALFAVGLALLFPIMSLASSNPVFKPTLSITKASGKIDVDGQLNDPGWIGAAKIDNFVERNPGDNIPPLVETEVFVTYDNDNLYVAFICQDDPAKIRVSMGQYDNIDGDDLVGILLDPYGTATIAYECFVNPYGIQNDGLWSNIVGEDYSFNLIWKSAAKITASGYQVEMAIPFTSLRFPNKDVQTWKMDFWRIHPRDVVHQYSWTANDRNEQCWPCQWGTIEGITNVHPGKGIEILPAFVGSQAGELGYNSTGDDFEFDNHDAKGELSLNGKYSISSDVTAEAAYNPDFSQIEGDADQIDVNSTISLLYPERRPYFQEGSDIFRTMFNSFNTRTVYDPEYTAKLTGRMGKSTLGFLFAYDNNSPYMIPMNQSNLLINSGKSAVNVLRWTRSLGGPSRIGFMVNDRRFEDNGSNTILSLDGRFRMAKYYSFDFQFIGTHTKEQNNPALTADDIGYLAYFGYDTTFNSGKNTLSLDGESFYGSAFITRFYRRARNFNFMMDYNQVDRTYRTETGYDPTINQRTINPSVSYTFYFKKGLLSRLVPSAWKYNRWDFDGNSQNDGTGVSLDGQLSVAQANFGINLRSANNAYNGKTYDGIREISGYFNGLPIPQIALYIQMSKSKDIAYGFGELGNATNIDISSQLKPIDRLIVEPEYHYARMTDIETGEKFFSGYIARVKFQYQATTALSLRLVTQYNDFRQTWDVDPLLTYRLNSFSVFYVGSTYDYNKISPNELKPMKWEMASRQFFMKLQYLFQA